MKKCNKHLQKKGCNSNQDDETISLVNHCIIMIDQYYMISMIDFYTLQKYAHDFLCNHHTIKTASHNDIQLNN